MPGEADSLWCFSGPELWALTADAAGDILPPELGPWVRRKTVAMSRADPEDAQVLLLVQEHGYCCFDPNPTNAGDDTT